MTKNILYYLSIVFVMPAYAMFHGRTGLFIKTTPSKMTLYNPQRRASSFDASKCTCTDYAKYDWGLKICKSSLDCSNRKLKALWQLHKVRRQLRLGYSHFANSMEWQNAVEVAGCPANKKFIKDVVHDKDFFKENALEIIYRAQKEAINQEKTEKEWKEWIEIRRNSEKK